MKLARRVEWESEGGQNGILERPMFPAICADRENKGECKMTQNIEKVYKSSQFCQTDS